MKLVILALVLSSSASFAGQLCGQVKEVNGSSVVVDPRQTSNDEMIIVQVDEKKLVDELRLRIGKVVCIQTSIVAESVELDPCDKRWQDRLLICTMN